MKEMDRLMSFILVSGRLERRIQKMKTLYMEKFGLKGSDLPILFALYPQKEGLKMEEAVEAVGADKSQISRSLKNLSECGLVEKENRTGYKGRYRLSETGRKLTSGLAEDAAGIFDRAHACLDDQKWKAYYEFMDELTRHLDAQIDLKLQSIQQEKKINDLDCNRQCTGTENK